MIDHPDRMGRLLTRLRAALPLPACLAPELAPELAATLQQGRDSQIPSTCSVGWISYGADEAGIVCRLEFEHDTDEQAFASITYLRFDARQALAREIAAYQKHRVRRLRRQPA